MAFVSLRCMRSIRRIALSCDCVRSIGCVSIRLNLYEGESRADTSRGKRQTDDKGKACDFEVIAAMQFIPKSKARHYGLHRDAMPEAAYPPYAH